jgi:hypothetical protein
MSLPSPWVDRIFHKLALTFGKEFVQRWEGLDIGEVKADWAHELSGYQKNPEAIRHGIETCITGKPPTVHEFKAACARYQSTFKALPSPLADRALVAAELAKARAILTGQLRVSPNVQTPQSNEN